MSLIEPDAQPHHTEEPRLPTRGAGREPIPDYDRQSRRRARRRKSAPKARGFGRRAIRALYGAATLLLLAFLTLLCIGGWLRHAMRESLPQLDGDLHVVGLRAPVTVTRDAQGVPSIHASSIDDVLFAQGYITAQDRLWQMDSLRRHAAGELAEILGRKFIEHDRLQRILQLRAAAERGLAALPPDQVRELDAYSRGVNAFIEQNGDHLPVEFHLLHYKPEPWSPRDSMLVSLAMFQDLATEFPAKMRREALSAHLPAQLLADLYPVGSWRDRPPAQAPPDLTTPKPEIQEIPLDDTQTMLAPPSPENTHDLLHLSHELDENVCSGCQSGSNNWAVAGSRSASGLPLVSNDMHLSLSVPDIWYEAALHTVSSDNRTNLDVFGFTLPGSPFVIAGRNAHVAWGFTNLGGDVQDVRVEHTRGSGQAMEYQKADGTWAPVVHHREHIRVRAGRDIDMDVLTTTYTLGTREISAPVISPLFPAERRVLSLAWTAYDPANLNAPFLDADRAADGAALIAAFSSFGGPSLNLIYADDSHHIGYHALGRIPVRGPAQRSSRGLAAPSQEPAGPAPPDNDEDQGSQPQASWRVQPFDFARRPLFLEAAYRPRRQRASRLRKYARAQETPPKPAPEPAIPAPAPPIGYTIGSAISPLPVDALNASQIWSGYIPYDQLPAIVNPPSGILATANARITPDDYPYFIANDWIAPYRAERIHKLLEGRSNLTPDDMLRVQTDIHSEFDLLIAQRLAYAVDHASAEALRADANRLHQAADLLRSWNGTVSADSPAAAIVLSFRLVIWPMLLKPQIAAHDHLKEDSKNLSELAALYRWGEDTVALESLLQHTPARWLPPGVQTWNDLLTSALVRGLAESHAPADLSRWRFGALHPVEIQHPVFSISPLLRRVLGVRTGSGRQETGGDGSTVKAIGLHFGPSERFTGDLADGQSVRANITTGESGNPASAFYFDQFLPWLTGKTFAVDLRGAKATHTLRLLP